MSDRADTFKNKGFWFVVWLIVLGVGLIMIFGRVLMEVDAVVVALPTGMAIGFILGLLVAGLLNGGSR